jgi:hypothetical protein
VKFDNGNKLEYIANVIAENLFSMVNSKGNSHVTMDLIVDHKTDDQVLLEVEAFVELKGKRVREVTTKGWKLCGQWKDGSTSWAALKAL